VSKQKTDVTDGRMSTAERELLDRLMRDKAKVAKDDADARGKWLLADAEAKLAAIYDAQDDAWAEITEYAKSVVEDADAAIAAICRQRGVPEKFRPRLCPEWYGRGVNASKERRAELRKVAQTRVAALVKEAQVLIDRQAIEHRTQIARAALTSDEARAFLDRMPTPEQLLPPLSSLQLPSGEVVALEAPVTQETVKGGSETAPADTVTPNGNKRCAHCGKPFTPSRRDGKFCQPSCRLADWRQRHKATDDDDE
jgi:hypothetical protein